MLFNTETLEPLYRFSVGQPGSSFTFEVAQMNGITLDLIQEAKSKVNEQKVNMDKLLSELQSEKTYLEKLNKEHIEAQEVAMQKQVHFDEQKKRYDEKYKAMQENIATNNSFILLGKKFHQFIGRYVTKSRKKDINQPLLEEIKKYISVEKSKSEEARRLETLKATANLPVKKSKKQKVEVVKKDPYLQDKIAIGSTVKLIETKQSGTVEEFHGNQCTVVFGFLKMKVEKEKLMWVK